MWAGGGPRTGAVAAAARSVGVGQQNRERTGVLSSGRVAGAAPNLPSECPAVPSMPDLDAYEILQDDDGTFAVVFARTGRVVHLNGVAQLGLDIDRADGVANYPEAVDHIAATRTSARFDTR